MPAPKILHKLFDHAVTLRSISVTGEHQVRGRDARIQFPGEAHADHLGNGHVVGLAQHHRFGLDAADPPAHDADAVDHGGVRIGAHHRSRERR